jgi:hypothetical protein
MSSEPALNRTYRTSFELSVYRCFEGHGLCWHLASTPDDSVACPQCQSPCAPVESFRYNPSLPERLEAQYASRSNESATTGGDAVEHHSTQPSSAHGQQEFIGAAVVEPVPSGGTNN